MPPNDPVLGVSAITGQQSLGAGGQPPMTTAAFGGDDGGASDLSRAARSLESVQGNVAGQTQAIQTMTMASQQQAVTLGLFVNQLANQVSTLSQSVGNLAQSMTMASMPVPSAPPPPVFNGGGGPGFGGIGLGIGRGALTAGAMGLRAAGAVGGVLGTVVGGIGSPFFGSPTWGPQAGGIGPRLGQQTGVWGGGVMATGLGVTPEMMRQSGAAALSQAGQERMQQRFADIGIGLAGGVGGTLADMGASTLGFSAGNVLAGGGAAGLIGGMAGASLLSIPVTMATEEIMSQTAGARALGNQFGRQAHRFMAPGGTGFRNLRRPDMMTRLRFGQEAQREAIQDLTFDTGDMQQIFAGMSQQDLMRGVGGVEEVVRRFRETKETFKLIGRRMGQGLDEAAETIGALQEIGFRPAGRQTREAVFGATSVMGMTPTEATQRAMQIGGQYARQGFGQGMFGIGLRSMQTAQSAIQSGALSNIDIAALGGREGAGQAMAGLMGNFLQSQVGQAALLSGTPGAGLHQMMANAGARASRDINRLVNVQLGGEEEVRELLKDPSAVRHMVGRYMSEADILQRGSPGLSIENALRLALKNDMPSATGAQLSAYVKLIMSEPKAQLRAERQKANELGDEIASEAQIRASYVARTRRAWQENMRPVAEGLGTAMTQAGAALGRTTSGLNRSFLGLEIANMGTEMDVETLAKFAGGDNAGAMEELIKFKPGMIAGEVENENNARRARNKIRSDQRDIRSAELGPMGAEMRKDARREIDDAMAGSRERTDRIAEIQEKLRDPKLSRGDRGRLVSELLNLMTHGKYKTASKARKRLYQEAVESKLNIGVTESMLGPYDKTRSGIDEINRDLMDELQGDIASLLDLDDAAQASVFVRDEFAEYAEALHKQKGAAEAQKKILELDLPNAEALLEKMKTMDRDEAGEFAQILRGGGGRGSLLKLSRKFGTEARADVMGQGVGQFLRKFKTQEGVSAGLKGLDISDLTTGRSPQRTMRLLGDLSKAVTEDDLRAMKASDDEVGGQLARALEMAKKIGKDIDVGGLGGVLANEKGAVAEALGIDLKTEAGQKKIDKIIAESKGHAGEVVAAMMLSPSGTMPLNTLVSAGGNIRGGEAKQIFDFMQTNVKAMIEYRKLAQVVERLTTIQGIKVPQ